MRISSGKCLVIVMFGAATACGGGSAPANRATTAAELPPAAEASVAPEPAASPRDFSLAELEQLPRADMEREWGLHGVTAIPTGCSHQSVEITYDASGVPSNTTKPTWTGKCIDKTTLIPANILSGQRKDATDKPAAIKPSSFDQKEAIVFEYPGNWSLHLREMGKGLYLGRQARDGQATGVVYLVGDFHE
jgi:hypothetical protein